MVSSGDLVVVAVSGGPDSMCLLDVLAFLRPAIGARLHVAHLNHHMRQQAESDARGVFEFAQSLGIPCTVGDADVLSIAREQGIGEEEAGREARYAFLRQLKSDLGASRIALGHNLNDQAETVLMRLLRGAGTHVGLGAGKLALVHHDDGVVLPLDRWKHWLILP
jgi:tRNA(Ile)-lysidine synthase